MPYRMLSSHRKVWSQYGACTTFPALFAGDLRFNANACIKICNTCPVKELCLEWALSNDAEGIYGGTTTGRRKEMRKDQARLQEIQKECPPEPKLLDYVVEPPKVTEKPKTVKVPGAMYTEIRKPSSVVHETRVVVRKTPAEPRGVMASLDQVLLELQLPS